MEVASKQLPRQALPIVGLVVSILIFSGLAFLRFSGNEMVLVDALTTQFLEVKPTSNGLAKVKIHDNDSGLISTNEFNAGEAGHSAQLKFSFPVE